MRHHHATARRNRRGTNLIEFALTLPAFMMLLAVLFDFGWLFFQQAMMDAAIHEGCRAGAVVDPEAQDPETVAKDTILTSLNAAGQACPASTPVASRVELAEAAGEDESTGAVLEDDQECAVILDRVGERPAISMQCEVQRRYEPLFGLVPSPEVITSSTRMRFEWQDLVDGS